VGLFSSITKAFKQVTGAVVTGGLSIVAPKLVSPITRAIDTIYDPKTVLNVASAFAPGIARPAATIASSFLYPSRPAAIGGDPMGLNISGILSTVGNIFGGAQNPYFQGVSNVANLASGFFPQPVAQPVAQRMPVPVIPKSPFGPMGPRVGGAVGRSFFNRFPNLAAVIQRWRDLGHKVTRAQLYSMLKRWGPEVLVSGGLITAAAVSELMVAGPGHRRMNPGNVKALRRSLRRLESFHQLCQRADKLRRPRGSRKGCKTGGAANFVRQG